MSNLDLIPTAEAAQILGLTVRKVTYMATSGELPVATQAPGLRGARFFFRADVERLARQRAQAAAEESRRILDSLGASA